jgi:hypothetical protein
MTDEVKAMRQELIDDAESHREAIRLAKALIASIDKVCDARHAKGGMDYLERRYYTLKEAGAWDDVAAEYRDASNECVEALGELHGVLDCIVEGLLVGKADYDRRKARLN